MKCAAQAGRHVETRAVYQFQRFGDFKMINTFQKTLKKDPDFALRQMFTQTLVRSASTKADLSARIFARNVKFLRIDKNRLIIVC